MNEHPTWRRMDDSASDIKGPLEPVRRSSTGKVPRISARSNRFLWGIAIAGLFAATMVAWPPNLAWRLGSNRRLIAEETQSLETPAVKAAREQAKLLQEVFATTLDVIHERYFHGDRAAVPARAMEDVFHQLQRRRFAGLTLRIALDPAKAPGEPR
jgi:hypothetical protein